MTRAASGDQCALAVLTRTTSTPVQQQQSRRFASGDAPQANFLRLAAAGAIVFLTGFGFFDFATSGLI